MLLNEDNKRIWIDVINAPHVHFFHSLLSDFNCDSIFLTSRQKSETIELLKQYQMENTVAGRDYTISSLKVFGILARTANLIFTLPPFDISISMQNGMSALVSKARHKTSILFDDNDYRNFIDNMSLQLSIKAQSLANHYIVPKSCYDNFLYFIPEERLIYFNGYKEDISISGFKPNPDNVKDIPFDDFIVIRPEALDALYVKGETIVDELITNFSKEHINIVLLLRDKSLNNVYPDNVYVPQEAMNGLDLCYYSQAVLTGSGTMAREAACMEVPAVSFFPGERLLSVDQQLVNDEKMIHSRDPEEIVEYVLSHHFKKISSDFTQSKKVKREVVEILRNILR